MLILPSFIISCLVFRFILWSLIVIKQLQSVLTSVLSIMLSYDFLMIPFLFLFILLLMFPLFFYRLRLWDLCALYCICLLLTYPYLMSWLEVLGSCLIVRLTLYLILTIFVAGCVLFGIQYFSLTQLSHFQDC